MKSNRLKKKIKPPFDFDEYEIQLILNNSVLNGSKTPSVDKTTQNSKKTNDSQDLGL